MEYSNQLEFQQGILKPRSSARPRFETAVMAFLTMFFATSVSATNHQVRIDSVMAGFNGDTSIQFVQIAVQDDSQKLWGKQGAETVGRVMLVFFDAEGVETGKFVFPSDPPPSDPPDAPSTVLIATAGFAALPGSPAPDFIIPGGSIQPGSGKVCFKSNPENESDPHFPINLCLSYGDFAGDTEGAGLPVEEGLPITGAQSLNRFQNFTFSGPPNEDNGVGQGTSRNEDFELGTPTVLSTAGPPAFEFFDFGDAPVSYGTLLADGGPRHRPGTDVLFLGERRDPEGNGQPNAAANGDDFDGPPSDDDGVIFTSALQPGQAATLEVTASAGGGFLNAWVDHNGDGDWDETDERVFSGTPLAAGLNSLNFVVPGGAVVQDPAYARFRISGVAALTPHGEVDGGEVEDYAVEITPLTPAAGGIGVRITEVMAGLNGDSSIQFVELEVAGGPGDKAWGPQGGEAAGRAMLIFSGADGTQTGRFVFDKDAPAGGNTILVATQAFADKTGLIPDFVMPPEVIPVAGQVAFRDNPANSHFAIDIALSYGGNGFTGATRGGGPPLAARLPITGANSLAPENASAFGTNSNSNFSLAAPSPENTRGETAGLAADTIEKQGEKLFTRETFLGNGRTCASCHVPGSGQFGSR